MHTLPCCSALLLILLTFATGCERGLNPQGEPADREQLIIHGFSAPGKSLAMKVGRVNPARDAAAAAKPADEARVSVSWQGTHRATLKPLGEGLFRSEQWKPRAGREYNVEITHPGLESVEARAHLPEPIRVSIDQLKIVKRLDKGDPLLYQMTVRWQDPPDETNYYELRAQATILDSTGQLQGQPPVTLLASNPGYEKRETRGLLIHDRNLEEGEVEVPIYADARFEIEGKLAGFRIELRHVNKAYFNNRQSLPPELPSQPSSTLFQRENGIEQGFGYIAGFTTSSASVGAY